MPASRRILFGVFDWGLGHATRDTPLIQALLSSGDQVEILSTGRALRVLQERFGADCPLHDAVSVSPPYTKTRHFMASFIVSLPSMLISLNRARTATLKVIRQGRYDLVISDCRYDVYDAVENSILINHQLRFKAARTFQTAAEMWLARAMSKFGRIFVPDYEGPHNLSGLLSHRIKHFDLSRVRYLGILSHLNKTETEKDLDCFISLTGPEPQRSILERKVLLQVRDLCGRIVIAGGNPDARQKEIAGNVEFYSYLGSQRQEEMMNRARFFISRSGYTSIMELAELGLSQVLLVPTPGQTEQEYLGDYYEEQGLFHHVDQDALRLKTDIAAAQGFKGFLPPWKTKETVRRFLAELEHFASVRFAAAPAPEIGTVSLREDAGASAKVQ
jgi:uncharacterized protein (TIGR00661 family)